MRDDLKSERLPMSDFDDDWTAGPTNSNITPRLTPEQIINRAEKRHRNKGRILTASIVVGTAVLIYLILR